MTALAAALRFNSGMTSAVTTPNRQCSASEGAGGSSGGSSAARLGARSGCALDGWRPGGRGGRRPGTGAPWPRPRSTGVQQGAARHLCWADRDRPPAMAPQGRAAPASPGSLDRAVRHSYRQPARPRLPPRPPRTPLRGQGRPCAWRRPGPGRVPDADPDADNVPGNAALAAEHPPGHLRVPLACRHCRCGRAGAALHAARRMGPDDSAARVQGKGEEGGLGGRAAEPRARRGPRSLAGRPRPAGAAAALQEISRALARARRRRAFQCPKCPRRTGGCRPASCFPSCPCALVCRPRRGP